MTTTTEPIDFYEIDLPRGWALHDHLDRLYSSSTLSPDSELHHVDNDDCAIRFVKYLASGKRVRLHMTWSAIVEAWADAEYQHEWCESSDRASYRALMNATARFIGE